MSDNKRLDIDSLTEGRVLIKDYANNGFVDTPPDKQALHSARYFKDLFLPKLREKGLSDEDIIENLDISVSDYREFLDEKFVVTTCFANKLAVLTGMSAKFWLRGQRKCDDR